MTRMTIAIALVLVGAARSAALGAQAAGAPPAPLPPAADAQPAPGTQGGDALAPEAYTYDPAGRRDPFVSLLTRGTQTGGPRRTTGLAGLPTDEVMVRGVLQSRGSYLAMVSGPDGKTYTARANDRLLDGVIRSVTPQGIVIMQEVNDPLSLVKQREVRKGLRTGEDAK